jgi:hypothetical protein
MAEYEFSIDYSEALAREAIRACWWHQSRRMRIPSLILAVEAVILFWWSFWSRDISWPLRVGAGILFGAALYSILWQWGFYRAYLRLALGRLRRMKVPRADIKLQAESLTMKSDLGAVTLPWSEIKEILTRPALLVVFTRDNNFFSLPTRNVPVEGLDFIRSRGLLVKTR